MNKTTLPAGSRQPKHLRTCTLIGTSNPDVSSLLITIDGMSTGYVLRQIGSADAECGLELCKLNERGDVVGRYHVELNDVKGQSSCDCLGNLRWGHCKHVECTMALLERGKLVCRPVDHNAYVRGLDASGFSEAEADIAA